jgi:dihydrofolate reductase
MRKLKLQMQLTADGFVGTPKGELDWMQWNWDDELKNYVWSLHDKVDTIVMGRKMAYGFIPYWAAEVKNEKSQQLDFAKKMYETEKFVFTRTLQEKEPDWENTELAKGEAIDNINKLKKQDGGDIIVYGGAEFVSSLIKDNVIDDLYLFVNPTAIGEGLAIFNQRTKMELVEGKPFSCGIVLHRYRQIK